MTDEEKQLRLEELKAKETRSVEEMDEMAALEAELKPEAPVNPPTDGGTLNVGG